MSTKMKTKTAMEISEELKLIPEKKEKLRKTLEDLHSFSSPLSSFNINWTDIEGHFAAIELDIAQRLKSLQSKEAATARAPSAASTTTSSTTDAADALRELISTKQDGLLIPMKSMRAQITAALASAQDPAALVLDAVIGPNPRVHGTCVGIDRAGVVFGYLTEIKPDLTSAVKERAKELADVLWSYHDASAVALPLIRLITAYKILDKFQLEAILDRIALLFSKKRCLEVFKSLGIQGHIPDLVEKLISKGKQLDALELIDDFGLLEKYSPVPILEAYIGESRKAAEVMRKKGKENGAKLKELGALKFAIKYIAKYNLSTEWKEKLERSVAYLEQSEGRLPVSAPSMPKDQKQEQPKQLNKCAGLTGNSPSPATVDAEPSVLQTQPHLKQSEERTATVSDPSKPKDQKQGQTNQLNICAQLAGSSPSPTAVDTEPSVLQTQPQLKQSVERTTTISAPSKPKDQKQLQPQQLNKLPQLAGSSPLPPAVYVQPSVLQIQPHLKQSEERTSTVPPPSKPKDQKQGQPKQLKKRPRLAGGSPSPAVHAEPSVLQTQPHLKQSEERISTLSAPSMCEDQMQGQPKQLNKCDRLAGSSPSPAAAEPSVLQTRPHLKQSEERTATVSALSTPEDQKQGQPQQLNKPPQLAGSSPLPAAVYAPPSILQIQPHLKQSEEKTSTVSAPSKPKDQKQGQPKQLKKRSRFADSSPSPAVYAEPSFLQTQPHFKQSTERMSTVSAPSKPKDQKQRQPQQLNKYPQLAGGNSSPPAVYGQPSLHLKQSEERTSTFSAPSKPKDEKQGQSQQLNKRPKLVVSSPSRPAVSAQSSVLQTQPHLGLTSHSTYAARTGGYDLAVSNPGPSYGDPALSASTLVAGSYYHDLDVSSIHPSYCGPALSGSTLGLTGSNTLPSPSLHPCYGGPALSGSTLGLTRNSSNSYLFPSAPRKKNDLYGFIEFI